MLFLFEFTNKKNPFNVCSIETDLSLLTFHYYKFLLIEYLRVRMALLQKYL